MSYRSHPDQQPFRHCSECECVLTADEDFMCEECEDKMEDEEDD